MRCKKWQIVMVTLSLLPARATVGFVGIIAQDDFEDDPAASNEDTLSGGRIGPFGPGDATGAGFFPGNPLGTPGRWEENLYDVVFLGGTPWYDPSDENPDTNWQAYVTDEPFMHNSTAKLWFQNSRIGDGIDNYGRDVFLRFTDGMGNPTPAVAGDTVKGSIRWNQQTSVPVFVFTSDLDAMKNDNFDQGDPGSDALHVPLTESCCSTDFFLDHGISTLHPKTYYGSVISPSRGFDTLIRDGVAGNLHTWIHNSADDSVDLVDLAPAGNTGQVISPAHEPDGCSSCIWGPFKIEFEFVVGSGEYTSLRFTADQADVPGALSISFDLVQSDNGPSPGSAIPMTNVVDRIEGIAFTDTGRKQTQYWLDDICIEILSGPGAAARCGAALQGDANNDNQVTGGDIISVQQNFGTDYTNGTCDGLGLGDANDDCLVTGADLIAVQQNFGKVLAAPVPEPAMVALLAGCLLARRRF